jgi:hypothetical protein
VGAEKEEEEEITQISDVVKMLKYTQQDNESRLHFAISYVNCGKFYL